MRKSVKHSMKQLTSSNAIQLMNRFATLSTSKYVILLMNNSAIQSRNSNAEQFKTLSMKSNVPQ